MYVVVTQLKTSYTMIRLYIILFPFNKFFHWRNKHATQWGKQILVRCDGKA